MVNYCILQNDFERCYNYDHQCKKKMEISWYHHNIYFFININSNHYLLFPHLYELSVILSSFSLRLNKLLGKSKNYFWNVGTI